MVAPIDPKPRPLLPRTAPHSSGPIAKRRDRKTTPGIPTGETLVNVEGAQYEALFRKVAVNVLRHSGNPRNELRDVLRRWFGPDAGLPGTNFQVAFRPTRAGWTLELLKPARADAPAI